MRSLPKALLCFFALVASAFAQLGGGTDRFAQTRSCANCRWLGAHGGNPYHYRSGSVPDMGPIAPGPTAPSGPSS
jgi:hypothetical protein